LPSSKNDNENLILMMGGYLNLHSSWSWYMVHGIGGAALRGCQWQLEAWIVTVTIDGQDIEKKKMPRKRARGVKEVKREERNMVHGTWYMVHGTWYMVHGTWYMVHGVVQHFMVIGGTA
jgi:hypothetical protein